MENKYFYLTLGFFAQLAVRSATLLPLTQYYLLPLEIIL
jgi:hypothetical protein